MSLLTIKQRRNIMKTGKETPIRMLNGGPGASDFIALCNKHGVTPTKRQFSKFRNKKGRLFNAIKNADVPEEKAIAAGIILNIAMGE